NSRNRQHIKGQESVLLEWIYYSFKPCWTSRRGTTMRLSSVWARWALGVLFFLAVISSAADAEEPPAKRVLIISTGSRLAPGFVLVDQQLLRALENIPSVRTETYAE